VRNASLQLFGQLYKKLSLIHWEFKNWKVKKYKRNWLRLLTFSVFVLFQHSISLEGQH
jgi:hypothetical protein